MINGASLVVIPGRRVSAEPGIHTPQRGLWIPGSRTSFAPRNDRVTDGNRSHSCSAMALI